MCGVAGILHFDRNRSAQLSHVEAMTKKLIHRGPDDLGFHQHNNMAMGFRRLSIIGLSNGNQPLMSEDGSITLVCNGEIFNYVELKAELKAKGYKFKTDVDVEVIIPLYQEYDLDFVNKLNGQFGFALYDARREQLICARDHAGITPFFYTVVDDSFIFGSEIKAILEHPAVEKKVNLQGLDQIFTLPGLVAPNTMFEGIHSLPNGTKLIVTDGMVLEQEYWDLEYPKQNQLDYNPDPEYYIRTFEELFERAITLRLRSDVDVGCYISGGLDSSLIAEKMKTLDPATQRHTFAIDFKDAAISERYYQQVMSNEIGSIHHETCFDPVDIVQLLEETYNTAALALSRMARQNNIKVVLSGEGADELFAGYVGYRFDEKRSKMRPKADRESLIRQRLWGDSTFVYEKQYAEFEEVKLGLYSQNLREQFEDFSCTNEAILDLEKVENCHVVHRRSYIDFKLRLVEHLISDHGDRMLMANSVEGRFPFLDKDLMEFCTQIPVDLKIRSGIEKYLLKQLGNRVLPREIVHREKFSFVAPGSDTLIKRHKEWANDLLSYNRIKRQGYFDADAIERIKKQYQQEDFKLNLPFDNDLLITVLTFNIFLDQFGLNSYH